MAVLSPYEALEVMETRNRVEGTVWWVRDEDHQFLWNRVEYVERRLQCWCDQGQAHAESPATEPECAHLRAVVEHRTATSPRPNAPVNAGSFVD